MKIYIPIFGSLILIGIIFFSGLFLGRYIRETETEPIDCTGKVMEENYRVREELENKFQGALKERGLKTGNGFTGILLSNTTFK